MAKILFYYSLDGKQSLGPVDADGIRKLADKGTLTRSSFIRPVNASDWQPWDPVAMSQVAAAAQQSTKPGKFVKPVKKERRRPKDEDPGQGGPVGWALNLVALLAGLYGLTIWMHAPPKLPPDLTENAGVYGVLGAGIVALIVAPSVVAACFFQGATRTFIRTAGIVGLAIWLACLHPEVLNPNAPLTQQLEQFTATVKSVAEGHPVTSSDVARDNALLEDQVNQLSSKAVGDSVEARSARALVTIARQELDKEKAAQAAFDSAKQKVDSISNPVDLPQCRDALTSLSAAQQDIINFFRNYPAIARAALLNEGVPADQVDLQLQHVSRRKLDAGARAWSCWLKVTNDYMAIVDFLASEGSAWSRQGDKYIFTDHSAFGNFSSLVHAAQADEQFAENTSKESSQVLQEPDNANP